LLGALGVGSVVGLDCRLECLAVLGGEAACWLRATKQQSVSSSMSVPSSRPWVLRSEDHILRVTAVGDVLCPFGLIGVAAPSQGQRKGFVFASFYALSG
jgi:hypothetical protein